MPSFHQGDFFRALSASREIDLQVVFARDLTEDRVRLGWERDLGGYPYQFLSAKNPLSDALRLAWSRRGSLHVVNGLWADPNFAAALTVLALMGSTYLVHGEAPNPFTRRSLGKRLLRSAFGTFAAKRAAGALSVSHLAADFYQGLGVREESTYPFGYFRCATLAEDYLPAAKDAERIEIIFVGQLIRRKGIDILIEAMRPLFEQHPNLYLTVVGAGEIQDSLNSLVEGLGLAQRVAFDGVIASDKIPARLACADLLVLPSRWDGWGLVVNEALVAGIPVIVSDRCGAADLVRPGINGYVFRSEDVTALRACLAEFLSRSTDRSKLEMNAAETGSSLLPAVAAAYLIACLKHIAGMANEKPVPPWSRFSLVDGAVN